VNQTRRVRLSTASLWVWGVAAVAGVLAVWHGWGILITPERTFFWFMTFADLVVVAVAVWLGRQWPRHADIGPDGIVLLRQRVRYDAVTEIRMGDVSAKPFWLAFWLPTSLVVGLIVALMGAGSFAWEVLEINTANGRARLRWRTSAGHDEIVKALRAARPDLEARYGLDGTAPAQDFSPRMSVGGGLLAACLAAWAIIGGWSGLQLLDQSTLEGPYSVEATSTALARVTDRLKGYDPLPDVHPEYQTWNCDRTNYLLGPSSEVVDLHLKIVSPNVPEATADAIEARLRHDSGMPPDDYLFRVGGTDSDVAIDIPVVDTLYIEIFTGCVDSDDLPALRQRLDAMAAALGAR